MQCIKENTKNAFRYGGAIKWMDGIGLDIYLGGFMDGDKLYRMYRKSYVLEGPVDRYTYYGRYIGGIDRTCERTRQ